MKPTVIIRACAQYEVQKIRGIVREGLELLGLRPRGRTLVKPNLVASGPFFPHAYTRPELMEGVLLALRDRDDGMTELAIGERCGITVPTRYSFKNAGYGALLDRIHDLKFYPFEEVPQVEIPLYHSDRLRDSFFTPEPVAKADFFVNVPKFKAHPWTTVTFSMKNYIGIQDDRHRLLDHDHALNAKVADLQYIAQPQFIVIDAITAGEGRMLTPLPYDLGLVIMGNNQVAFDAVCCQILGLDPLEVEHIRLAHERGFGPVKLDQITLAGDVSLEKAQERASRFRTGLIRVEDYFKDTNIRAYGGRPPSETSDYCWGGCPGALEEAIEILRIFDKNTDTKMPPVHIVFGKYDKPIDAKPGEKLVFIGDCAEYHGDVAGKLVNVPSRYVDRSTKSPYDARDEDIFAKMAKVYGKMWSSRREDVIVLGGCPVSVAEQVLALVNLGGLKNPYFDPRLSLDFTSSYLSSKTRTILKRAAGRPYQIPGGTDRGDARPPQSLPPPGANLQLEGPKKKLALP
ncbi:DUF362 domain-containing protein [Myxococcota bacterium]|nr:DUF362 domain-containing protein [Myxococcota bacterium]